MKAPPADTGNTDGTGDPTADTNSTPDSTDEGAAVESEPVMLLAASAATAITPSQPTGDGSVGSPYQIGTAAELYWFADKVNNDNATYGSANAILTKDITVNTGVLDANGTIITSGSFTSWTPIGNDSNIYTGTFDGANYTISGLYFNDSNTRFVGLFGYIGSGGRVSNVGVVDSYFNGKNWVGGLCGYSVSGTIENCYNAGTVKASSLNAGGVCGLNYYGTISNCYNTGTVNASSNFAGGVCGMNSGTISNCYNTGAVSASYNIGGVCGEHQTGTVVNCYNTGAVSGNEKVGGVCGDIRGGTIANCYFDSTAYSGNAVGLIYGGTVSDIVLGKATAKFTGGEVAYLLWHGCTVNEVVYDGSVWGQTIGTDNYPVFSGAKVYPCTEGCLAKYANTEGATGEHTAPDTYDNGFGKCTDCNVELYQPAEQTTTSGIYEIGNAGQLYWFAELVNGTSTDGTSQNTAANAVLMNDITVNNNVLDANGNLNSGSFRSWTPIGNSSNQYTGTFDGNNKKISGLYFNDSNTSNVGLFGYSTGTGTIKNVGVVNSYFNGCNRIGGVCAYNCGYIYNCYNTGTVSGNDDVGGVCGMYSGNGDIRNCYNTGTVSGSSKVGGICGDNRKGLINCYYLDTTASDSKATSKTEAQFASGEVAYLLNGSTSDGTLAWGQTLTGETPDAYPVLGGAKVYPCTEGCTAKYANEQNATGEHTAPDTYDKDGFGKCTDCNADVYQPATLNNGVYQIGNAGQLYWFADKVNNDYDNYKSANAVLTADITVNSNLLSSLETDESGAVTNGGTFRSWMPIGWYDDSNHSNTAGYPYTGTFDGQNHTISGLYFNDSTTSYVGLFGYSSGTIKNVGVVDSYFNGAWFVGGVCGQNISGGTIANCYNTGGVSGSTNVGGVNGRSNGTITNCYNTGEVSGNSDVGGVCGLNWGSIANCYYLADTADDNGGKTTAQFASGEVAYLLSLGCTVQDEYGNELHCNGDLWGQDLSTTTNYPVLDSTKTVYLTTPCPSYTNTENETKAHTDADENGICDLCDAKTAYVVSLGSQTADGAVPSVAKLDGGGNTKIGESTTITASAVPGYTFNGWYNGETQLSADLSFVYTPTADVTLTAKYTANAKMTVTINGGDSYYIAVNELDPSNYSGQQKVSYAVGTKLTLTANGDDFAYWENEAGSVLSRNASYTFTVVNGATVTAVYNTKTDGKATVIFISGYDQVIARKQYADKEDVSVPAAPTKTGCNFAGWSINGAAAITENVADAVKAAITAALATEDTADDIINVKATYTDKVQKVTVTVNSGSGSGEYNVNDVVTVTANAPAENMKFSHWTDGNGTILSYNKTYVFYAAKDIALTAEYVADTVEVEAVGTTEIVDVIKDTTNGKISFVSMSTVPEGCTIVKAGVVATTDSTIGTIDDNFKAEKVSIVRGDATSAKAYQYTWTAKLSDYNKVVYVRAYLVYTDKNGNSYTVYGGIVSASVNG